VYTAAGGIVDSSEGIIEAALGAAGRLRLEANSITSAASNPTPAAM